MVLILRLYLHESDHHNNSFLDHLYCVSLAPNHSMKNTVHILHRPKFTPVGQSNTAVLWIVKAFACSYDTARRCKALLYQKTKKKNSTSLLAIMKRFQVKGLKHELPGISHPGKTNLGMSQEKNQKKAAPAHPH